MKKILLVWPYHRKDWIQVFIDLSEKFEFHYLSYIHKDNDNVPESLKPSCTHYWSEYKNANDILDTLRPEKIVFMSIDSALNVALNLSAKKAGIITYILQHGIYANYRDYRIRERLWNKNRISRNAVQMKKSLQFSTLEFIKPSFSITEYLSLIMLLVNSFTAKRKGPYFANRYFSFKAKQPSYYICFSENNARIHKELDNPDDSSLIYTGSPELDRFLERVAQSPVDIPFMLHIDQAMAENSFGEETIDKETMICFYNKLNKLAKRMGLKLYIKLHPESYQSTWLPVDSNIYYLRATSDLNAYMQFAELCTGFYSTLVVPAAYWSKLLLFNISYSYLQESLAESPNVSVINFCEFDPDKFDINSLSRAVPSGTFEKFFYSFDGQSLNRIKAIFDAN